MRRTSAGAVGSNIGGSDASGVVWAVGSEVKDLKVGDTVVMHCGQWRREDPGVSGGGDPMFSSSFRIWGYETSWGSFGQFTKVQAVNVLDTYVFELALSEPFPTLHYWLADPWNVLGSVAAREEYGDRYGFDALVGTGPYVFKEWVRGERVVLERVG